MAYWLLWVFVLFFASSPGAQDDGQAPGQIRKNGIDIDVRSVGKQISDALQQAGTPAGGGDTSPGPGGSGAPQIQTRGGNVQVNDPGLDNIQILSNLFPVVKFNQNRGSTVMGG